MCDYIWLYICVCVCVCVGGRRMIGISVSLIWSRTLMELIFSPYREFRWSLEGPVSQIHSPRLHVGAPGIFSYLLRFVQILKREWSAEKTGSCRTYLSLVKLQPWFLSLQWKTCLLTELQPWFLRLQWKICSWAEHSGDDLWTFPTNDKCTNKNRQWRHNVYKWLVIYENFHCEQWTSVNDFYSMYSFFYSVHSP